MGKVYETINDDIQTWIAGQKMFFVGTAPRMDSGSINVSPKGHDTLRVVDNRTLAFLDYGGSGVETIAHLRENGRIVIMMCAFEGAPKIYRFHGSGVAIMPGDPTFAELANFFDRSQLGVRAIIRVDVARISDSCGYGVPKYAYEAQRTTSPNYIRAHGVQKIRAYLEDENLHSIDGLPGISAAEAQAYQPTVNSRND